MLSELRRSQTKHTASEREAGQLSPDTPAAGQEPVHPPPQGASRADATAFGGKVNVRRVIFWRVINKIFAVSGKALAATPTRCCRLALRLCARDGDDGTRPRAAAREDEGEGEAREGCNATAAQWTR
jgi:hypothetical protein